MSAISDYNKLLILLSVIRLSGGQCIYYDICRIFDINDLLQDQLIHIVIVYVGSVGKQIKFIHVQISFAFFITYCYCNNPYLVKCLDMEDFWYFWKISLSWRIIFFLEDIVHQWYHSLVWNSCKQIRFQLKFIAGSCFCGLSDLLMEDFDVASGQNFWI